MADTQPAVTLILSDHDLPDGTRAELGAVLRADAILSGDDRSKSTAEQETLRIINEALPAVIAKRVRAIRPPGFIVSQLELKISIKGEIAGIGMGGEVLVKLAPEPPRTP